MNAKIIRKRVSQIRRVLNTKKLECLIVINPFNVSYATGFCGDESWAVITPHTVYLLTDSRYIEQAQSESPLCRIIERAGPMTEAVSRLLKRLKSIQKVNLEISVSLRTFKALKKKLKVPVKPAAEIIEPLRAAKDSSEISAIRDAARIAGEALRKTRRYIKAGISENELAGRVDLEIRKSGGINSFETIVAFGPNASRPHHQPGSRRLKKIDTVLIDMGVRYKGYCCDLTRCFAVGRPDGLYKKVYKAVQDAQAAAIARVKPGVEIKLVDAAAREVISSYGLPVYGHGTGHGLGLEVHEEPAISPGAKGKLKAGMVFTIEPGVYIPGKLGVRIEDDVVVTEKGCRILSRFCPHWPVPA